MLDERKRIAVLIDAENISPKYVKLLLDEASNYGSIVYKRIYGDWSNPATSSWRSVIMDYSIYPIQQFSNTKGKNASDSAMIIDAMDLLHTGRLQGFCIVSSDSDFTRLALRLRESEMFVLGMGEKKTPTSFISACDRFVYLDMLLEEKEKPKPSAAKKEAKAEKSSAPAFKTGTDRDEVIKAIGELIDEQSNEDGRLLLSTLGSGLLRRYPDFDTRNFGYRKLRDFVKSLEMFECESEDNSMFYIWKKRAKGEKK